MTALSRRAFLRSSAGGLASALVAGPAFAANSSLEVAPPPRPVISTVPNNLKPQDTLFLTWQRDPTTTITVQWVGPEKPETGTVRVSPRYTHAAGWKTGTVLTKPFGNTEVKV